MSANQKTVALENSRKGFRNTGKVFYTCWKSLATEKSLERLKDPGKVLR